MNKSIIYTKEVDLKYFENNISIEFTSLSFVDPSKNLFAYKLEGFDKDWVHNGNFRRATYTNLPPGRYVFKARATNSDGVWNKKGVSLTIVISPPFWRTWWFYLLCLASFALFIYSVHAVRVAALRKRSKILKKLVAEKTKQLKAANMKLEKLSLTDPLTRVANRRYFGKTLELEWRRGLRGKYSLSIIMIDIDYFKLFNDNYGHVKGDECLKRVATVLKKAAQRSGDFIARYGGEEFVVILPNTDLKGACFLAELMRSNVEKQMIPHEKSTVSEYVTISLGVSTIIPGQEYSYDFLLKHADKALYRAKQKGRNCVDCIDLKELLSGEE